MGEKMSLQQVRDWAANTPASNGWQAKERYEAGAALDAHLTQPAQALDVGAIREVIASHIEEAKKLRHDPESQDYLYEQTDKLTAAHPKDSNGKEG